MNICDKQKMHLLSSNLVNTKLHENSSLSASLLSCRMLTNFFMQSTLSQNSLFPKETFSGSSAEQLEPVATSAIVTNAMNSQYSN